MSKMMASFSYVGSGAQSQFNAGGLGQTSFSGGFGVGGFQTATSGARMMDPSLPVESLAVAERTGAEVAIRHLTREIDVAQAELGELEQSIRQELAMPSVRGWLLPLMAIGLALSFYGSFVAVNSATLGATGLMLLWSLSAFWFIYTREKRVEMAREAHQAEIEIWSSRIEELERAIEQNRRMIEAMPGHKSAD